MITTLVAIAITASVQCNNTNWQYSQRCNAPVAEFSQTVDGFEGTLTNGIPFTQTWIGADLMLFRMESVAWLTDGYTITYINI